MTLFFAALLHNHTTTHHRTSHHTTTHHTTPHHQNSPYHNPLFNIDMCTVFFFKINFWGSLTLSLIEFHSIGNNHDQILTHYFRRSLMFRSSPRRHGSKENVQTYKSDLYQVIFNSFCSKRACYGCVVYLFCFENNV